MVNLPLTETGLSTIQQIGILTGAIAGVGTLVLAIANAVHQRREGRPRLRVRFMIRHIVDRTHGPGGPVEENAGLIELANVGRVPITGSMVGIKCANDYSLLVASPTAIDDGPWPREIPPTKVCLLRFNVESLRAEAQGKRLKWAFATSIVGDTFRGSRRDMRAFRKELARLGIPEVRT